MRRAAALIELAGPVALVVAAALFGAAVSQSTEPYFTDALVKVGIVVALYVFIGTSGVLSFGHISFVAIGAWTAGVLSVPAAEKPAIMPNLAGFAGGLYVHLLPLNTETVYLDLTFITLAMLVIGGATSLWGAVVGALAVSAVDSFLAEAENGLSVFGRTLDLPAGTRVVVVGALMALVLILRPNGLTGGREFRLPLRGTA